jgi:ketosteroid isomerase-like protein
MNSPAATSISGNAQGPSDRDLIRDIRNASNQAIAAGDATNFAASLDEDFVVVTGNGSLLSREAYITAFAKDFEDPQSIRFERIVDSIEISDLVPLAAEHGHWAGRISGGQVLFGGTYLAMWRRTERGWKLRSELFIALACKDTAAGESYRGRYGATLTKSEP